MIPVQSIASKVNLQSNKISKLEKLNLQFISRFSVLLSVIKVFSTKIVVQFILRTCKINLYKNKVY